MKILINPKQNEWASICQRPSLDNRELNKLITSVFAKVKKEGDAALFGYARQFDNVQLKSLRVTAEEIEEASLKVDPRLKKAIQLAIQNVEKFHLSQKLTTRVIQTSTGVTCWQQERAIEKVGLYIPGGSAPLFSTIIMLAVPAKIAGCPKVILCTPPNKTGKIHPAILYAAKETGITNMYKVGGAQAIAAMVYGTDSIPKAYKIFGPGNQYVTAAKQLAQQKGVAIDMPAGPSELLVYADKTANPAFVAADLLSQAEHGADSQVICVVAKEELIKPVKEQIAEQVNRLPRKETALKALKNSLFIVISQEQKAIDFINEYAPEHLIVCSKNEAFFVENIQNAGSVFLGNYSPESAGDYASGTNHTLPTSGYAKSYSGLTLGAFTKTISFQKLTGQGIANIGPAIELMAEAEGLQAHKNAVSLRLNQLQNNTNYCLSVNPATIELVSDSDSELYGQTLIKLLVRKNIRTLSPYSSARDEFNNEAKVFLDANENPYGKGLNRYPDPFQKTLKKKLAKLKGVSTSQILLGNGSDEVLDLLFRAFCEPGVDNTIMHNPGYGMYPVLAGINHVNIKKINLEKGFKLNAAKMIEASDKNTKLFFICSPNNPSGNILNKKEIKKLLNLNQGLVVIDEAYIDFAQTGSWLAELDNYPNLVVCQTLSKAWGLAGLRVGAGFASNEIIKVLNTIKPPYNLNVLSQQAALDALNNKADFNKNLSEILYEKAKLEAALKKLVCVKKVYPSNANFLLVKVQNATKLYDFLLQHKVVVRNRTNEYLCDNCLRITIGTPKENKVLLTYLKNYAS